MPGQTARTIMARSEMTLSSETNIYSAMKSLLKHRLVGAAVVGADSDRPDPGDSTSLAEFFLRGP